MLRIDLRNEVDVEVVNGEFVVPKQADKISVYACTDGISCYIATVKTVKELDEVIAPENIMEIITEQASEDEFLAIEAVLFARDYKYLSYDGKTILTAIC